MASSSSGAKLDLHHVKESVLCLYQDEKVAESIINLHDTSQQSPPIKEALREIKERLVHRWHFLMLNDMNRNSVYYKAITEALKKLDKPVVLDIGSGTSILRYMY